MSSSRKSPASPSVRSLKVDTPSSILPLKGEEERHRIVLKATQTLDIKPPAPPLKCYLCSRSKVLPMFQVEQPKADEGGVYAT